MPREKTQQKFKCMEICCGMLIRSDKWIEHCRRKHAFKHARNGVIKYKLVGTKSEPDGVWVKTCSTSQSSERSAEQNATSVVYDAPVHDDHESKLSNMKSAQTEKFKPDSQNFVSTELVEFDMKSESDDDLSTVDSPKETANDAVLQQTTTSKVLNNSNNSQPLVSVDPNDPAVFAKSRILSSTISLFVQSPSQPNSDFVFPETNGRSFVSSWFRISLPDGTFQVRHWLTYSKSTDVAYCLDCLLFGGPHVDETWARDGFHGWTSGHGARAIERHENSTVHRESELARFRWLSNTRIDKQLAQENNQLVEHNRRVVVVAIKAIQFLAAEMLALRGRDYQQGKFMNLFKLLAQFDTNAASYLTKLDGIRARDSRKKPEVNFLSPLNVRRLLTTMKAMIVESIAQSILIMGSFSLICDGTQDKSKLEAEAVLVRYIQVKDGLASPVERLVGVFTTGDTSGGELCNKVTTLLQEANINVQSLVGQSYDGAGNVRGGKSGLQSRLIAIAPKALYVWCQAHRLNLVIEAMLACNTDIVGTIGLLQELHNFFGGHKRHSVFLELQKTENQGRLRSLKRVSDTTRSWRSVEDGVNTLLDCYTVVLLSLEKMKEVSKDAATVNSASGLVTRMHDFSVIVCLHILRCIFSVTGPVSRLLQGVSADLAISATLLTGCVDTFQQMRDLSDEKWDSILVEAAEFAKNHDIDPTFTEKRVRKTKRMPGEKAKDERITDAANSFKVNVFVPTLDRVLVQLKERFSTDNVSIMKQMQVFSPASLMSNKDVTAEDIHELCVFYGFDPLVIATERQEFSVSYRQVKNLISLDDLSSSSQSSSAPRLNLTTEGHTVNGELLDLESDDDEETYDQATPLNWAEYGFIKPLRIIMELSGYPSLTCLYKILVSLAITSCSAERAMSRVRIIKNRLRSTMLDDWFSALMVLSAERDLLESLTMDDIINRFACSSTALQKQLVYG